MLIEFPIILYNKIYTISIIIHGYRAYDNGKSFSDQLWHLTSRSKFDQTNLLYIINGEVNKFMVGKEMSGQFSTLIINTAVDWLIKQNVSVMYCN